MSEAARAVAAPRLRGRLPLLLGFLSAVGPLSIDMYLPAFPAIEREFHAAPGAAQITLATWILGLSIGQLLIGAIADRFGRRLPLLLGTTLYAFASAGCALSPSIPVLAVCRFVAAIGASASMIVPRAIVRDVAEGHEAARLMTRLILILGAAPILAPSLGGMILSFATWRDIFWITTAYGALGATLAGLFLPDTLHRHHRVRLHLPTQLDRYRIILTDRGFLSHALMLAFLAFALFAYLGGMPTTFIVHFHLTPRAFALVFGGIAAGYILVSQLNMRLVSRLGLSGTLTLTSTVYLSLLLLFLALAWFGIGGPIAIALVLAAAQATTGCIGPTATVGALTRHAAHAGSASAMLGTLQFLIGSSSGFLIAWLTDGTPVPMAGLMAAGALALKLADLWRPAEPHQNPMPRPA